MWRDICIANRDELLRALDAYAGAFERLRAAIAVADGAAIFAELARAQLARRHLGAGQAARPVRLRARRGARRSRGR